MSVAGIVVGGSLTGVAVTSATSAVAHADTPEAFAGSATAQALKLNLFGTVLTVSSTNVSADSTPKAHADGSGLGLVAATVSSADATGANNTVAPPKACGLNLPIANILTVALACSQSASATVNGAPGAIATSNIAAIDVGLITALVNLLQPVLAALTPIADSILVNVVTTVQSIVQPVLGTTLLQLLQGLGINPAKPVSSLITALEKATNLVTVHVGDTTSSVTAAAGTVVADAKAQAAEVDVLPGLLPAGGPLLSIIVGDAHTTSTFNRAAGTSAATFSPAILTVKLLGLTVPIGLGAPITLLAGTPLESTISLGAGSTTKNADGSVGAVADGVSLDLLKGINNGISLSLAHAATAIGGHAAVVTPTTVAPTTTLPVVISPIEPIKLATTGTSTPLLPVGFILILAGYLTRRGFKGHRASRASR